VSVLLIACSTVLSGARSFAAIGQWAKNAPLEALARLCARTTSVFAVRVAPSTATVRRIKAHYALCVKKHQVGLYERLHTLPWREVTAKFYDRTEGHGRKETRVVQVLTVDDLDFPHAAQVARVVLHRTCLETGRRSRETVYVITDLTSREASPQRLAKIIRSQWVIENRLHFVRDTAFREDASKVHAEHGPENMAPLRSFAINCLRAGGHHNIAAGFREMSYEAFTRPLTLLGLRRPAQTRGQAGL
jgi:predicted transposase YbfD/YdcC